MGESGIKLLGEGVLTSFKLIFSLGNGVMLRSSSVEEVDPLELLRGDVGSTSRDKESIAWECVRVTVSRDSRKGWDGFGCFLGGNWGGL